MSVIPVDDHSGAADSAARPGFWQRFARALDEYFIDRTKRAVPELALRRCRQDVSRVRRLAKRSATATVEAGINRRLRRSVTASRSQP